MDDQNKPTERMHSSQCKCTVKCNECRVAGLVAKKITNACRGIIWGRWMDGWAEDAATRGEGHTI